MICCTRRIQFCCGHRVLGHEGKCSNLHGHNYVAFITAMGDVDSIGRVVDFSVLKEKVGGWIDEYWDHGCVLYLRDDEARRAVESIKLNKLFLLDTNPTAENMAAFLLTTANTLLTATGVKVTKVVLWETENCYAEVSE